MRVGLEATGYSRWFERLLAELGFEVWIGDAAEIKRQRGRKQKTDREDGRLLLRLLLENRFPRIWVPNPENRDLRQLLWHRHRLVQMRTRIMNQLQAVAMNEGYRWKKKLFSEKGRALLEKLSVGSLGQSAPERVTGAAGPAGSKDCGVNGSPRARSPATARGGAVDDASWRGTHHGAGLRAGHRDTRSVSLRQEDRQLHRDSFPVKTPVPASNGWDISASKATRCCATCWEKQRKQPHGATRTGDVGMCT